MSEVVVVCVLPSGAEVGARVAGVLGGVLEVRGAAFEDVGAHLRGHYCAGRDMVVIGAAGIVIRVLAPMLADKRDEPGVVAVAEDGSAVVPPQLPIFT